MKRSVKEVVLLLQPILILAIIAVNADSSLRSQPLNNPNQHPTKRTLMDGTEACSSCPSPTHQCVGRSVSDELCGPCAAGENFWPCNVAKECWCWDTSLPKDPGDEDGSEVCKGCSGPTEACIANQNSLIPADDEGCAACATGQKYWPCDTDGLCWCWDNTKPKKPPAPSSGMELADSGKEPCDLFTEEMYKDFAPNNTFPYTYQGFCDAIADYNLYHDEKVFGMGTEEDQRNEIAAFLGNTAHESDDYEAGREYLACGDNKEVDGKVYCKPCTNDLYDWKTNTCSQSMADLNSPYSEYCQSVFQPPEGCNCTTITQVAEDGELAGYIDASKVFYGRGAIQLSWNYNYIKASYALTGSPDTFCDDPELVVSDPLYAWGSAIYFWMESEKEGDTCHKEALKHNFGGTLNVINGGLECPAYAGGWHHTAVKLRINRYCHAAALLDLAELGSMSGCKKMDESLEECLGDGTCPFCEQFIDGEYHASSDDDDSVGTNETVTVGSDESDGNETVIIESDESVDNETVAEKSIPTNPPSVAGKTSSISPTAAAANSTVNSTVSASPTAGDIPASSTPSTAGNSSESTSPTSVGNANLTSGTPTVSSANAMLTLSPAAAGIESNSTSIAPTVPSSSPNNASLTSSPTAAALESTGNSTTESASNETSFSTLNGTAAPAESEEENTFPTWSPTAVESTPPSYSPTTPAPTLGPCDGDPCPDSLCRSTWGFCGEGEGYCNDSAIWSPDCPEKSGSETGAPSPAGSSSATGNTTFAVYDSESYDPYDPEPYDPYEPESKAPTPSESETVSKFEKPTGGKKPPPNKKPGVGSSETSSGKGEVAVTDAETPLPSPPPATLPSTSLATDTPAPELPVSEAPTPLPGLSPDDPAATYFCGIDWIDANKVCAIRCPSAKSEDCPDDQSCYAFTRCNDPPSPAPSVANVTTEMSKTTEEIFNTTIPEGASPSPASPNVTSSSPVTPDMASSSPVNSNATTTSGGELKDEVATDSGCTGKPCEIDGECRSQFGFCGSSFIYCNDLSSWSLDSCGLFGTDANGETLLCDAEIQECSTGEKVIRNPDNNCDFFPCPTEEEGEGSTFSAFDVPATSPSLPELPKPTLPTISDPKKPDFNSLDLALGSSNKGNQTIDLGSSTAKDQSKVVVIGDKDEVADDKDEASKVTNTTSSSESENADPYGLASFESFSYEDWQKNGSNINGHRLAYLCMTLISVLTK